MDVCGEMLGDWRMVDGVTEILDLKAAYLEVRVAPELWKYQFVKYKGKTYCLTRLGFGLSSAPKMMSSILKYVLGLKKDVMSEINLLTTYW